METKIRTASRDYVCDNCGTSIPEGSEYRDTFWHESTGQWIHKRCHKSCGVSESKDTIQVIEDILKKDGAFPVADSNYNKVWVIGTGYYPNNSEKIVFTKDWKEEKISIMTVKEISTYHDINGFPL